MIVEPPSGDSLPLRQASEWAESGFVRAVDVVRAVLLALDLKEALRGRFRRLERLQRGALLVELVEAMLAWVAPASDSFKCSLLEYLGHPNEPGRWVRSGEPKQEER